MIFQSSSYAFQDQVMKKVIGSGHEAKKLDYLDMMASPQIKTHDLASSYSALQQQSWFGQLFLNQLQLIVPSLSSLHVQSLLLVKT